MPKTAARSPAGIRLVPLIGPAELRKKIRSLARKLNRDYRHRQPVIIGVLNGSFMFCAELARSLELDCEFDFIRIASYGKRSWSSGRVKMLMDVQIPLRGRHVLLVEDIVDSGKSVTFLRNYLKKARPRTLKVISLLYKESAARGRAKPDYCGFTIPDHFVVGFGLDYGQKMRNMKGIYRLVEPTESVQEWE